MKKAVAVIFTILFIFLIFTSKASAAPAPWGIALNESKKECAGYWAGDEFTKNPLPSGWKDYYPDFLEGEMTISTPAGTCIFGSEESCCDQLGYEYVSENIGRGYDEDEPPGGLIDPTIPFILGSVCCCFTIFALTLLVIFFTTIRKKK